MKVLNHIFLLTAPLVVGLFAACADSDSILDDIFPVGSDSDIHIGGIDNARVETSLGGYTSRATTASRTTTEKPPVDAETVDWLLGPLFGGLDITYGAKDKSETEKVAILRLLKQDETGGIGSDNIKYSDYQGPNGERIAEYSFRYHNSDGSEGENAKWYDNGLHYFQGVFVPANLRYSAGSQTDAAVNDPTTGKAPSLKVDQSKDASTDDNANYTLLERYLGMPADAYIHATVGRIKLPFRHRLARVQAYVLIDPTMGPNVTIKGYKEHAVDEPVPEKDDAETSSIRFCNVKVLAGVRETSDAALTGHSSLTPIWAQSRKVIPHFVDELASVNSMDEVLDADNFIMFYNTELKTYIFPANDDDWEVANEAWNDAYDEALGSKTSDEDKRSAADYANQYSGYERTLYGKVPCYDLVVRPTYTSEDMVMYDEDFVNYTREDLAGETNLIDFEITLNNGLQYEKQFLFDLDANDETIVYLRINRESIDYNSSGAEVWKEDVFDDGYYGVNNQNGNTLSFAGSSWQRAYRIGSRNPGITDGHYYGKDDTTDDDGIQTDDAMPWYPQYVSQENWLKMFAEAHEGGLHHGDYFILDEDITIDARQLPANFVFTGHLDGQDHTITVTGLGETVVDEAAYDEDCYVTATSADYSSILYTREGDVYTAYTMPATLYVLEGGEYVEAHPTIAEMMVGTYYVKNADDTYTVYTKPTLYANHPLHHDAVTHVSGSALFAGLNGVYPAAIGEANVHRENGIFVPYVDAEGKTGWRAEIINTCIKGGALFPAEVFTADGAYDVSKVSGYIYNCWQMNADNTKTAIKPHTPTLPKYK